MPDTNEKYVSVSDLLESLTRILSQSIKTSTPIPTESFKKHPMSRLKEAIRALEKAVGVPAREGKEDYFIKAIVSMDGAFQRLSLPDLALASHDGVLQPCFIWHNVIVPAKQFLTTYQKGIQYSSKGEGKDTLFSLKVRLPEDEETEAFTFRCWTQQKNNDKVFDTMKMRKDVENYLEKTVLAPYVFTTSGWLTDGTHDVVNFGKKDSQFVATLSDGRLFYISEKFYGQLTEARENQRPTQIICDGTKTTEREGVAITYKNIYVGGYPPATKIQYAVFDQIKELQEKIESVSAKSEDEIWAEGIKNGLVTEGDRKDKKISTDQVIRKLKNYAAYSAKFEPIEFNVKGLINTPVTKYNTAGFLLVIERSGKVYNIVPNSRIKLLYSNLSFDLAHFDGVKMTVKSIGAYGENLSIIPTFDFPKDSKKMDAALEDMMDTLGLPL